MSRSALFLLDERRPLTSVGRIAWVAGILGYTAVTVFVVTRPDTLLTPMLWVPVAHALVVSSTCAFTAVLLAGQATTSGRRGYLWLAGTYTYVAGVLLTFPLFFPGALDSDGPLLGGQQSAPTLFYAWHLAFPLGLMISILVLHRDRDAYSEANRRVVVWHMVLGVAGFLALTLAAVSLASDVLPTMVDGTGHLTALSTTLDQGVLVLSALCVALAAFAAYRGAPIQRWLLAVAVLLLGESVVNLSSTGRWTFAWYFDRLFGMVALSALFLALLLIVARAGRATTIIAGSDALTGAESRARFTKAMTEALATAAEGGRTTALLWVDMDGFKAINDELGHAVGDHVLRMCVQRIHAQVRARDHVGRLGGDEIGVLLCGVSGEEEISAIADRILAGLRDPVVTEAGTTLLSGSIGIATAPHDASTTQDLLLRADLAMYDAKRAGGDRAVRFDSDLGSEALGRAQLRHRISQAVRESELDLDLQPIVAGDSGAVAGYEALVRWQRGDQRIEAGEFVRFAERSGQIIHIGRAVIGLLEDCAPELLAGLPDFGFLTFNMSVKEIADASLVDRLVAGPLAQLAGQFVIEVTESEELLASGGVLGNLERLRAAGYRIALDDFGAGFSNFSRLEHLRPQLLKIDRLLLRQAAINDGGGLSFLAAAIGVADSLGCEVVVEGVETEEQQRIVATLQVPFVQGHRFGRPAPLSATLRAASAHPRSRAG